MFYYCHVYCIQIKLVFRNSYKRMTIAQKKDFNFYTINLTKNETFVIVN